MKLNFGCGNKKMKGFINIDISTNVNPDMILDIKDLPYQFKDNTVDVIHAEYVIEHIPKHKIRDILREWYRISKDGAVWDIWVPFYNSKQVANLNHYMGFDFESFDFLNPKHKRNYYFGVKAKLISVKAYPTARGKFIPFKRFLCHSIGQLYEPMHFKLQVIKFK